MKLAFSRPTSGEPEQRQLFTEYRAAGYEGRRVRGRAVRPDRSRAIWSRHGISSRLSVAWS